MLGRVRQALFPEADTGASWEKGAVGEERLADALQPLVDAGTIEALHDRRIPRSTANIDHLFVAASGIWVVDAKRYANQRIERDVQGGFLNARAVLRVGGRDRTRLVEGVTKQVTVVSSAVTSDDDVPVHGALCFIDGSWGLRLRGFTVRDVHVLWPKLLRGLLAEPGPLDVDRRATVRRALAEALPPAR